MRIGFAGASCCGKSTLVDAFHERHSHFVKIKEIASTFTEEERSNFSCQKKIIQLQIEMENNIKRDLLSDRTVFDNIAYVLWYYREHKYSDPDTMHECMRMFDAHMRTKPYDFIFFVDEYFPLENNGIRNLNPIQQRDIYLLLHGLIKTYGRIYDVKIETITGSTESRIKQIEDWFE